MANAFYQQGIQSIGTLRSGRTRIDLVNDDIRAMLVTADYTPDTSALGDEFVSTISSIPGAVVARSAALTGLTLLGGVWNCSNFTFSLVPIGSTIKYLIFYKNNGSDATDQLILKDDTAQGLPKDTDGGDVAVQIDPGANKLGVL